MASVLIVDDLPAVHEMLGAKPAKNAEDSAPDTEAAEEPAGDAAAEAQGS